MECPICGNDHDGKLYQTKISHVMSHFTQQGVHLTRMEAKFLAIVYGRNRPVARSLIMDGLYGDRIDGGPDSGDKIIEQFVLRVRRKIQKAGLPWKLNNVYGFGYELKEERTAPTMRRVALSLAGSLLVAHPLLGLFS